MAAAFIGFAVVRMLVSMVVGPLIDRWSALSMLPVLLVPAFFGIGALLLHDSPWIAWIYLILVGASQGMAGPMMTAVWAETYGVQSPGATKGMVATFGVMATALGPLLLGAALGSGMGFPMIIGICLAICGTCIVAAFIGRSLAMQITAVERSSNSAT